ncbi:MAG: hypothetical protein QW356_03930 [Candidatus Hadarchaeales archaeon]
MRKMNREYEDDTEQNAKADAEFVLGTIEKLLSVYDGAMAGGEGWRLKSGKK